MLALNFSFEVSYPFSRVSILFLDTNIPPTSSFSFLLIQQSCNFFQIMAMLFHAVEAMKGAWFACSLIVRSQHWHQSSINRSNVATGTALITQRRVKNIRSATYNVPLCRVLLIKRRRLGMWLNQNSESGKVLHRNFGVLQSGENLQST